MIENNNFKIGDKVKIVNFHDKEVIGEVGAIIEVKDFFSEFAYSIRWDKIPPNYCKTIPLYENEIELAVKVGEQLLFCFMEGEQNG